MLEESGIRKGKTLIVWTDNTTTETVVKKRKYNNPVVEKEWKVLQAMLFKLQTNIETRRVVSKENKAEKLSRRDK
jgi:hypothetical protein